MPSLQDVRWTSREDVCAQLRELIKTTDQPDISAAATKVLHVLGDTSLAPDEVQALHVIELLPDVRDFQPLAPRNFDGRIGLLRQDTWRSSSRLGRLLEVATPGTTTILWPHLFALSPLQRVALLASSPSEDLERLLFNQW